MTNTYEYSEADEIAANMLTGSPGEIAYKIDCIADPTYNKGEPRLAWSQLTEIARWSWERDPRPRKIPAYNKCLEYVRKQMPEESSTVQANVAEALWRICRARVSNEGRS